MLEGEFDLSEKRRLAEAFAIPKSAPVVALNLSKATYIDSTVLQCMIDLAKATRQRGARLVLTGLSGAVLRLLEVSSLDRFFEVQPGLAKTIPPGSVRTLTLVSAIDNR